MFPFDQIRAHHGRHGHFGPHGSRGHHGHHDHGDYHFHGDGGRGRGHHRHGARHGFSPDGGDGNGFMRGRKFSSDDLQLLILGLLAKGQSHGYELIKALKDLSGGSYSPSPGMIYPALTYIEELGYADVTANGNKKLYTLSVEGQAYLDAAKARVTELFQGLEMMARKMETVRGAMEDDAEGHGRWLPELVEAFRSFRHALRGHLGSSPAEQTRIAAILQEAIRAINASPEQKR